VVLSGFDHFWVFCHYLIGLTDLGSLKVATTNYPKTPKIPLFQVTSDQTTKMVVLSLKWVVLVKSQVICGESVIGEVIWGGFGVVTV